MLLQIIQMSMEGKIEGQGKKSSEEVYRLLSRFNQALAKDVYAFE